MHNKSDLSDSLLQNERLASVNNAADERKRSLNMHDQNNFHRNQVEVMQLNKYGTVNYQQPPPMVNYQQPPPMVNYQQPPPVVNYQQPPPMAPPTYVNYPQLTTPMAPPAYVNYPQFQVTPTRVVAETSSMSSETTRAAVSATSAEREAEMEAYMEANLDRMLSKKLQTIITETEEKADEEEV